MQPFRVVLGITGDPPAHIAESLADLREELAARTYLRSADADWQSGRIVVTIEDEGLSAEECARGLQEELVEVFASVVPNGFKRFRIDVLEAQAAREK